MIYFDFPKQVIFSRENPEPGCVTSILEHDHSILCIQYIVQHGRLYKTTAAVKSVVSLDYSDEDIGTTSSEGAYVFEELKEEEYQGLMVAGPYMHEPDAVDIVEVVLSRLHPWRRPTSIREWKGIGIYSCCAFWGVPTLPLCSKTCTLAMHSAHCVVPTQ